MKMEAHVVRYEGVQAFHKDIPVESNPYTAEGSQNDLAEEWEYGWRMTAHSNPDIMPDPA